MCIKGLTSAHALCDTAAVISGLAAQAAAQKLTYLHEATSGASGTPALAQVTDTM